MQKSPQTTSKPYPTMNATSRHGLLNMRRSRRLIETGVFPLYAPVCHGTADTASHGSERQGADRQSWMGTARQGAVWHGCPGLDWSGWVRQGAAGHGLAVPARCGMAGTGPAGSGGIGDPRAAKAQGRLQ